MDRALVWPHFRPSWIVYEDADVVAIDKPVGVSSQSADPDRLDDIVTRLKRYWAEESKAAVEPYLGVHQRLDRDTSGVLVFARRREANAGLAAQFEARVVKKTYIACVTGWPRGKEKATLKDRLSPGPDGRMVVERPTGGRARGPSKAKEAVTQVRVVSRREERAALELTLDTGRTHQARVQLANAGAPIAGDPLYGGAAAPRLLLHASAVSLVHPVAGTPLRVEAPGPAALATWLERGDGGVAIYDDAVALRQALAQAVERRWGLGRSAETPYATTAFRLVNEEGDALPRLAIDVYDGWLVAQLYGDDGPWADRSRRERVLDAIASLGFDGVYLKVRPKQANVLVDPRRAEIAPATPVRGGPAPDEMTIFEEGMPLRVRLGDGLSTGLFLDQRANRRRVRNLATGKTVANLFSYTCAFTVAAALGAARKTVSVDASVAALERGRANLEHAGVLQRGDHAFVGEDAFAWLARAARRGERFDLVIVDPPSYSTTRKGRFVASSDYASLAAAAIEILAPGGQLLACTNHRGITPSRFRRMLFDAGRAAKREVVQVKELAATADFPLPMGGDPHMKSALVTLGGG